MLVKSDPDGCYQIPLDKEDWEILEEVAANLQLIADVAQCDVFIDCPTDDPDVAIVVAEAKPRTSKSIQGKSFRTAGDQIQRTGSARGIRKR